MVAFRLDMAFRVETVAFRLDGDIQSRDSGIQNRDSGIQTWFKTVMSACCLYKNNTI